MSIKGYKFYYRPVTDPESEWVNVNGVPQADPDYTFEGLTAGTEYEISAIAVDEANNESDMAEPLAVTTPAHLPSDDPMSASDVAIVDSLVAAGYGKAKGVLLSITGPKGQYSKAYGYSYTDAGGAGRALTLDDKMHYGSTTKMNTALLIFRQIDAGHLSLDDTLDTWSTTAGVTNSDRITIKMLLMNRTGIYECMGAAAAFGQSSWLHPTSKADPLPAIRGQPSSFEPDTSYEYCNSNWILLGEVLRQLDILHGTGRTTPQIFQQDCYDALGITDCEWRPSPWMTAPYSRGWTDNLAYATIASIVASLPLSAWLGWFYWSIVPLFAGGWPTTPTFEFTAYDPSYPDAAGCLDGTVIAFRKFGEALRDGTLISPASRQLRSETWCTNTKYTPTGPDNGPGWIMAGLGIMQIGEWRGWNGASAGYGSALWYNVYNGAVVAIIHNYFGLDPFALFLKIAYALWPGTTSYTEPWTMRQAASLTAGDEFGTGSLWTWHALGDADGDANLPHKVPFYL